jgi:hypothetical protein
MNNQDRLVAGAAAIDGVGRKPAQQSPQQRRLGAPRSTLVADVTPILQPQAPSA